MNSGAWDTKIVSGPLFCLHGQWPPSSLLVLIPTLAWLLGIMHYCFVSLKLDLKYGNLGSSQICAMRLHVFVALLFTHTMRCRSTTLHHSGVFPPLHVLLSNCVAEGVSTKGCYVLSIGFSSLLSGNLEELNISRGPSSVLVSPEGNSASL